MLNPERHQGFWDQVMAGLRSWLDVGTLAMAFGRDAGITTEDGANASCPFFEEAQDPNSITKPDQPKNP